MREGPYENCRQTLPCASYQQRLTSTLSRFLFSSLAGLFVSTTHELGTSSQEGNHFDRPDVALDATEGRAVISETPEGRLE
jgi:hypothetical protein